MIFEMTEAINLALVIEQDQLMQSTIYWTGLLYCQHADQLSHSTSLMGQLLEHLETVRA